MAGTTAETFDAPYVTSAVAATRAEITAIDERLQGVDGPTARGRTRNLDAFGGQSNEWMYDVRLHRRPRRTGHRRTRRRARRNGRWRLKADMKRAAAVAVANIRQRHTRGERRDQGPHARR
jgi:hypothetical protein